MHAVAKTVQDYVKSEKHRKLMICTVGAVLTFLFVGTTFVLDGAFFLPLLAFMMIILIFIVWHKPEIVSYATLAAACLFETQKLPFKDFITDSVPFFWDFNSVVQKFGHAQNFHEVPISFFELLLATGFCTWLMRKVATRTFKLRLGALIVPISMYIFCVIYGIANGLTSGGDYHIALFEARAQFYFLIAYLMALNTGDDAERIVPTMYWIQAICIGIKGILCTFRFVFTLHGHTVPEQGIGSHEELFFFNLFEVQLLVLWLGNCEPKLRKVMLCLLPFVIAANLANERRAATAGFAIVLPVLLATAYMAFPARRQLLTKLCICILAISAVYFPVFWNKTGLVAQPARAIKSQIMPDGRDFSSDFYRMEEDANLMATLKEEGPVFGYGYGKKFHKVVQMVDLSDVDPMILYVAHDQILWIWMRLGTVGFTCFWIMVCSILIYGAQRAHNPNLTDDQRCAALYGLCTMVMLMIFGLLDKQLSNVRDMLFASMWVGAMCLATENAKVVEPVTNVRQPLHRRVAVRGSA